MSDQNMYKHIFLKTAFVVIPLLAMLSTSPIFILSGHELHMLPIVWTIALFPFTAVWVVNYKLYQKFGKGKKMVIVSFIIVICVVSLMRLVVLDYLRPYYGTITTKAPPYIVIVIVGIVNNSMVLIVQALIRLSQEHVKVTRAFAELKYQNMSAKYQNLKNQLHPHFLFNALSTLKILIKKNPQEAERYVLKLSDFLRASIEANKKTLLTLNEDLLIAMNYLDIQKTRFQESIYLDNRLPDHFTQTHWVPILTIQTLFENALKHNIISRQQPIHLHIALLEQGTVQVTNTILNKASLKTNVSGIGLENLNERFVLLGGHEIVIHKSEEEFSVSFKPFEDAHIDH